MKYQIEKNIIVIYHAKCLDGLGAAYSAWTYFKDSAEYIPLQHGQEIDFDLTDKEVYILYFSFKNNVLKEILDIAKMVVMIDHHISAIKELEKVLGFPEYSNFYKILDNSKSGAVLSWEYFQEKENPVPLLLKHIQDNDLWKFEISQTKEIISKLYHEIVYFNLKEKTTVLREIEFFAWIVKSFDKKEFKNDFISDGRLLMNEMSNDVNSLLKNKHEVELNEIKGYAVNCNRKYASDLGHELAKLSGTFGCVYYFNGYNWIYSLRSIENFDVSKIAVIFNGGGHKNASSFRNDNLLF